MSPLNEVRHALNGFYDSSYVSVAVWPDRARIRHFWEKIVPSVSKLELVFDIFLKGKTGILAYQTNIIQLKFYLHIR
jgi:hypothetical protein